MEKLFVEALGLFSSRFFPIWSLIAFLLLRTIPVEVVIAEIRYDENIFLAFIRYIFARHNCYFELT